MAAVFHQCSAGLLFVITSKINVLRHGVKVLTSTFLETIRDRSTTIEMNCLDWTKFVTNHLA